MSAGINTVRACVGLHRVTPRTAACCTRINTLWCCSWRSLDFCTAATSHTCQLHSGANTLLFCNRKLRRETRCAVYSVTGSLVQVVCCPAVAPRGSSSSARARSLRVALCVPFLCLSRHFATPLRAAGLLRYDARESVANATPTTLRFATHAWSAACIPSNESESANTSPVRLASLSLLSPEHCPRPPRSIAARRTPRRTRPDTAPSRTEKTPSRAPTNCTIRNRARRTSATKKVSGQSGCDGNRTRDLPQYLQHRHAS